MTTLKAVEKFVKEKMGKDVSGHDWWHVDRVRKVALHISENEGGDKEVIELAALLHDIADSKFNNGDHEKGAIIAKEWLTELKVDQKIVEQVVNIVRNISFSSGSVPFKNIEGQTVQDADRLEALGAIGIARCFATGAKLGNPIYNPDNAKNSIQHFDDKLFKLKDLMNTPTGKKIAEERHKYMQNFFERFKKEWQAEID